MASGRKASARRAPFDFLVEDPPLGALWSMSGGSGAAEPGPSRFLKRSPEYLMSKELVRPARGSRSTPGTPLTTSSKIRTSAALLRVAEVESKLLRRRAAAAASPSESDSGGQDEAPHGGTAARDLLSAGPPHRTFQKQAREPPAPSEAQSGPGSRFLKKRETPVDYGPQGAGVPAPSKEEPARSFHSSDGDEEDARELLELSRDTEAPAPQRWASTGQRGKALSGQTLAHPGSFPLLGTEGSSSQLPEPQCLPASPTAPRTLGSTRFPQTPDARDTAWSSSTDPKSSPMGCRELAGSPGSSPTQPLDGSEAAGDGLDDFRVNVFSIDDLAPAESGRAGEKQGGEDSGRKGLSGRSPLPKPGVQPRGSAFQGAAASAKDEDLALDSEVSEHLGSSRVATTQQDSARSAGSSPTGSLAYSEDFEPSFSLSVPADRTLGTLSQVSASLLTDLVPSGPQPGWGLRSPEHRETAVQTLDSAFACQWPQVGGLAAMGPTLGGAYVDPTPIASHVIGAEAVEALTAYSPAALALHELLKQQLSLTQHFVDTNRQLHAALLHTLDRDEFHYHTLKDTREYIRRHRPPPLSPEAALQEVREELRARTSS